MATDGIDKDIWMFAAGCAARAAPQTVCCSLHARKLAAVGESLSSFAVYADGSWFSTKRMPEWKAIAMASTQNGGSSAWLVVALGEGGQIWEIDTDSKRETLAQLPRSFGMTNIAAIGGAMHACGMGRVVLQRQVDGSWADHSAPWPDVDEGIIGFTDLAEHPTLGTVAVGWQGEVWTKGVPGDWRREDTPTNANFNAVEVAADGTVYCVGDKGAILRGRNGLWETVISGTSATLQDICCHEDITYVATDFGIHVLSTQGLVPDSGFDDGDAPSTALKVFAVQGVGVCLIGPNDAFLKRDGTWTRIS